LLAREYFHADLGVPSREAVASAIGILEASARYDSPEREVYVRLAEDSGNYYIDLGDKDWQAIEIDSNGWRIVTEPPVRFRRPAGMQPLPMPIHGGDLSHLREFLNVSDSGFVLVTAWLLAALRPTGPYPVLAVSGEQGTAKSSLTRILKALTDPSKVSVKTLPREERELVIAAHNSHLIAFDNVSRISDWVSDALCRLATGGGQTLRQLYTDSDEVLFDLRRPIIVNGIEEVVIRPDLVDRSIFLTLERIPEGSRKLEKALWRDFDNQRSSILGALLDIISAGLRELPNLEPTAYPRMADFAHFVVACETACPWSPGTFMAAYSENVAAAVAVAINADIVGPEIVRFMEGRLEWVGTTEQLLTLLRAATEEYVTKNRDWPQSARGLTGKLTRLAPGLRAAGIEYQQLERQGKSRPIRLRKRDAGPQGRKRSSQPSRPSLAKEVCILEGDDVSADFGDDLSDRDNGFSDGGRDDLSDGLQFQPSHANELISNGNDGHDDHDDLFGTPGAEAKVEMPHAEAPSGLCPTCGQGEFWRPSRTLAAWRCASCAPPPENWGIRDADFAGVPD